MYIPFPSISFPTNSEAIFIEPKIITDCTKCSHCTYIKEKFVLLTSVQDYWSMRCKLLGKILLKGINDKEQQMMKNFLPPMDCPENAKNIIS